MNQRFRPLTCLCALAMLTAFSSDAVAAARHKQTHHAKKAEAGHKQAGRKHQAAQKTHKKSKQTAAARRKTAKATHTSETTSAAATVPPPTRDPAAVRDGVRLVCQGTNRAAN